MAANLDIESPGYEFRRSSHYMTILYNKLIALNYGQEFCPEYKCRSIHKYYFSYPNQNANEQYFTFACLSAWLIKKKCNFNIKLDPQDYEDPEVTIRAIIEALRLILIDVASNSDNDINFAPSRLLPGYGPEVVWTLNVLADAALQIHTEFFKSINKQYKIDIVLDRRVQEYNENSFEIESKADDDEQYNLEHIDDHDESSLLFEEDNITVIDQCEINSHNDYRSSKELSMGPENNQNRFDKSSKPCTNNTSAEEWYLQVERVSHQLQASMDTEAQSLNMADWKTHLNQLKSIDNMLDRFTENSKPLIDDSISRIDKQLQIISSREKFLRTNLDVTLKEFISVKRSYDDKLKKHNELNGNLVSGTTNLQDLNKQLVSIKNQIEEQVHYLNDPSPITTIRKSIDQLQSEIDQFDIRIGLAMDALFKSKLMEYR